MVLVLVFHGVGLWRQRWMPRWLAQTLGGRAGRAARPPRWCTCVATSGDVARFIGNPYRVTRLSVDRRLRARRWPDPGAGRAVARARCAGALAGAAVRARTRAPGTPGARCAAGGCCTRRSSRTSCSTRLANVQALVDSGSPRAAPVLKSLIAYLRAAMPRLQEGHPRCCATSSSWCAPTSS